MYQFVPHKPSVGLSGADTVTVNWAIEVSFAAAVQPTFRANYCRMVKKYGVAYSWPFPCRLHGLDRWACIFVRLEQIWIQRWLLIKHTIHQLTATSSATISLIARHYRESGRSMNHQSLCSSRELNTPNTCHQEAKQSIAAFYPHRDDFEIFTLLIVFVHIWIVSITIKSCTAGCRKQTI